MRYEVPPDAPLEEIAVSASVFDLSLIESSYTALPWWFLPLTVCSWVVQIVALLLFLYLMWCWWDAGR